MFFVTSMGVEAVRVIWFTMKGGPPDVGALDILLGLALTAGLAGFLVTHTAWSRPLASKGRYVFSEFGVSFARQFRDNDAAPDWRLGWNEIRKISLGKGTEGFQIRLDTGGGSRVIAADLVRVENCPDDVRAANVPDSVPAPYRSRLIAKALTRYAPPELLITC
jgi:hypothetical protein